MKWISILLILLCFKSYGQFDVPLTLYKQFNGKYGYTIIGNTHNTIDNWNPAFPPCEMITESNATLNLLPTQNIVGAFLYLNGCSDGSLAINPLFNSLPITPDITFVCDINPPISPFPYFSMFKDITVMVQTQGNGTYSITNFDLSAIIAIYCSNRIFFSGWSLIVVYEQTDLPTTQLNIYHGLRYVGYQNVVSIDVPITNLNIIDTQNAQITYLAHNGSTNLFDNESILFNENILSNTLNPANNPFNGTNSFNNSATYWNQDIDTFDVSAYINVGDTEANLKLTSGSIRFISNVITSIRSELPDPSLQLTQVLGQDVCGNRDLVVNYTVANTNSNAALPANVPVSFFANDVFLQAINTPSSIAIGATLPLQTMITIPEALGNTIALRVVVNQNATGQALIPESNPNNNDAFQNITLVGNSVTTAFTLQNSFCSNDIVPTLPLLSNNGISGTWLPNVISNQTSGTYVFTPLVNTCAALFTLNVTVSLVVSPTFSVGNTFCQNSVVPTLSTTSNNGISGIWSPSVINNQTSGSYVFTPNAGQCANTFTQNISILPNVTPSFVLQNTFCQNEVAPTLPTISTNGVSGTWLPNAINNQTSGAYVFTPNVGQCGNLFTLNVIISPTINTTFNLANMFCKGGTVPALPTTSSNGFSGSWLPNIINNQSSQTYTFTPNAGQCTTVFALNVTIETPTQTTENFSICIDSQLNAVFAVDLDSKLNSNDFSFVWTKDNLPLPQNTAIISVTAAGTYKVVASSNGLGCQQIVNFVVTALPPLTANFNVKDDFANNQTIIVEASGGSGTYSYSFDNLPFQFSPVFSVADGGEILAKVKDNNNCFTISKLLTLWQYASFFTPNGDGFNDTWGINSQKKIRVDVFDQFGKMLKQLKNNESWNGIFNSQPLPANDYWFVIYYDGKTFKGHFSLKR